MAYQPLHLGVNVDHVATLRQARLTRYPDPLTAALIAEQAGADSITIHLREDRRHIQERDLELMQQSLLTRVNLEMAVTDPVLAIAMRVKPADCCLVPQVFNARRFDCRMDHLPNVTRIVAACEGLDAFRAAAPENQSDAE